ncbi:hypothetical protein LH494_27470 [Klebsiella pneumoniae]|uniref:hypothetical protein n=1 Tax=Klebsiella pneumoniae TaxID=573 RepID=UPI001E5EAAF2|nr:hypothetical protein [Klebsiella pneumoniae]MCC5774197.1 hypothetical protein [Klebsiella pneumoniae]
MLVLAVFLAAVTAVVVLAQVVTDRATRRAAVDALRKHYPPRRGITGLLAATGGQAALHRAVRALGAQLV